MATGGQVKCMVGLFAVWIVTMVPGRCNDRIISTNEMLTVCKDFKSHIAGAGWRPYGTKRSNVDGDVDGQINWWMDFNRKKISSWCSYCRSLQLRGREGSGTCHSAVDVDVGSGWVKSQVTSKLPQFQLIEDIAGEYTGLSGLLKHWWAMIPCPQFFNRSESYLHTDSGLLQRNLICIALG